jgi:uncharacterized membrane protein
LVGGGSYIEAQRNRDELLNLTGTVAVASIVIGLLITIISFLGCFGAANEKGMLLKTYFGMLILLVVLELSVGIAAYVKRDSVSTNNRNILQVHLNKCISI